MPDENQNPANLNNQKQSSQNQPSNDQTSDKPTVDTGQSSSSQQQTEPNEIQEEINKVAGQVQPQSTDTTSDKPSQPSPPPKPVVEETSASAPAPPTVDTSDDTPPPPPTPGGTGDQSSPPPPPQTGDTDEDQKSSGAPQKSPPPPPSSPPPSGGDSGSAPPSQPPDIPPVVTTPAKKKKKFGGKKVIATILGLLLLVGGIGAGVILVQQQQDIREEAKSLGECESDADCGAGQKCSFSGSITTCVDVPTADKGDKTADKTSDKSGKTADKDDKSGKTGEKTTTPECTGDFDCRADQECIRGECVAKETPTPTLPPAECVSNADCAPGQVCQDGLCEVSEDTGDTGGPTEPTADYCNSNGCDVGGDFTTSANGCWVNRYHCDVRSPGGCSGAANETSDVGIQSVTFKESCGTEQIDVTDGCPKDAYPNSPFADFVSKTYSNDCGTTSTGGPGISAQCLNIQAFDTEWNKLSATELSTLQPGESVRFSIGGTTTSGTIDKARFIINGQTQPEVTQKRPGSSEFYYEYTIPEGQTSFSINAQLHHTNPDIGWF